MADALNESTSSQSSALDTSIDLINTSQASEGAAPAAAGGEASASTSFDFDTLAAQIDPTLKKHAELVVKRRESNGTSAQQIAAGSLSNAASRESFRHSFQVVDHPLAMHTSSAAAAAKRPGGIAEDDEDEQEAIIRANQAKQPASPLKSSPPGEEFAAPSNKHCASITPYYLCSHSY